MRRIVQREVNVRAKGELLHGDVSDKIIGAFFDVYNALGYGFLESVYQRALPIALRQHGLICRCEVSLPVLYRGVVVGEYRADLIVANKVIVETKTAASIHPIHDQQIFNYLKAARLRVGLILNFGPKPTFQRYLLPSSLIQSAKSE